MGSYIRKVGNEIQFRLDFASVWTWFKKKALPVIGAGLAMGGFLHAVNAWPETRNDNIAGTFWCIIAFASFFYLNWFYDHHVKRQ